MRAWESNLTLKVQIYIIKHIKLLWIKIVNPNDLDEGGPKPTFLKAKL